MSNLFIVTKNKIKDDEIRSWVEVCSTLSWNQDELKKKKIFKTQKKRTKKCSNS